LEETLHLPDDEWGRGLAEALQRLKELLS
jgi:hypothetical protein